MSKPRQYLPLLLLTALAAAVRCATLGAQSLWLDEVYTTVEAGRPWGTLVLGLFAPQEGYPLYILGMRLWIALLGTGEAALRLPSALAGSATVPLLYLLGRRTFGRPAGLLAAALLALSPLAVWYAQEARPYAFLLLLTVAAWLLLWAAVERGGRWRWAAWVGLTVVALTVHRLAILSFIGQLTYVVYIARQGHLTHRYRRLLLGLLALTLLLTVAGLWFTLGREGAGAQFTAHRSWQDLANTWTQFSLRIPPGPPEPPMLVDRRPWLIPFAVAALAGLVALGQGIVAHRRRTVDAETPGPVRAGAGEAVRQGGSALERRAVFLLCFLAVPTSTFYLLYLIRPFYYERYLLGALPAYLLLLAVGVVRLGAWACALGTRGTLHAAPGASCTHCPLKNRRGAARGAPTMGRQLPLLLGLVALATGLALLASSWQQVYDWTLTRLPQKEQYREATRYLQERLHPGDLVVVHPGYIAPAVEFYAARFPRVPLPLVTITNTATVDYDHRNFDATMGQLSRGRQRACLLYAPAHAQTQARSYWVYEWFYLNPFLRVDEQHWTGLDLYCISFNAAYRGYMPEPQLALEARFGEYLLLWGADLEPFQEPLWPGDSLPLTLYLEGLRPDLPDLAAVVRLVAATDGRVWAEQEQPPLRGHLPTSVWRPGVQFLDYHELLLPADIPPGDYIVTVGFRELDAPGMLALPDGALRTPLGAVLVEPGGRP